MFNGPYFKREMESMYEKIQIGYSIGQCFEESNLFPEFMAQLIKDGERTGSLDVKIQAVAFLYKQRLENKLEWIFKMIAPAYFAFTILVSVFFIYAFFMPVWKIYL